MNQRVWLEGDRDEIVTYEDSSIKIIFSGVCPHFGGPLAYSPEKKGFVCPWHDWHFKFDGTCANRSVQCKVHIYQKIRKELT